MKNRQPAIDLANVSLRIGPRWILRHIDWRVSAGAAAAILGPNGSGKSSLARMILGQLWATEGQVSVMGRRFGEANLPELRKSIRLVQPSGIVEADPESSAEQIVLSGFFGTVGLYDRTTRAMRRQAEELLDRVGLYHVRQHAYRTLSSGERMRCLIARALVLEPQLLILDEPTAGLDLLGREQVLATVQSLCGHGPTVLIITHHLEELPPATSEVLLLKDGRVAAAGATAKVLKSRILSRVYGCAIDVKRHGGRYFAQVHPRAWKLLLKPARTKKPRGM